MDSLVEFVKANCRGWVILDHQDRYYEGDAYAILNVSDRLARYISGNLVWEENGVCLFHPYFGTEGRQEWHPQREITICRPLEKTQAYRFGYEYWGYLTFYPLDKRAELEYAMYERKLSSRGRDPRLMRDTELRP